MIKKDEYLQELSNSKNFDKSNKIPKGLGQKFDSDKVRMDLLPFYPLEEVSKVLTYGAKKYSANSWRQVPGGLDRYTAALLRHLSAWKKGEIIDPESGLQHLAHVACNALFLIQLDFDKLLGKNDE